MFRNVKFMLWEQESAFSNQVIQTSKKVSYKSFRQEMHGILGITLQNLPISPIRGFDFARSDSLFYPAQQTNHSQ